MRLDFDEIRTLTQRFVLIPQKVAKFVFGVFRYADLSVLGYCKLRKAINPNQTRVREAQLAYLIAGWSVFLSGRDSWANFGHLKHISKIIFQKTEK